MKNHESTPPECPVCHGTSWYPGNKVCRSCKMAETARVFTHAKSAADNFERKMKGVDYSK